MMSVKCKLVLLKLYVYRSPYCHPACPVISRMAIYRGHVVPSAVSLAVSLYVSPAKCKRCLLSRAGEDVFLPISAGKASVIIIL